MNESEDDSFGTSLVAANLGRGHQVDLAIGAKYRSNGGQVTVLYGTGSGLSTQGSSCGHKHTRDPLVARTNFEVPAQFW